MLTGKQFKLKRPTVCVERLDGHRKAVTLPAGAIIKVLSGSMGDGDRMVEVLWEDVARECGVSKHTICAWKSKYGGMDVNEAQEVKQLREENAGLTKLVADLMT